MADYLCIAEKPTAAARIASALDEKGKPKKLPAQKAFAKVPIWESYRNGARIIIIPALGHLYSTVEDSATRWHYPSFNYKWLPAYLANEDNNSFPFIMAFQTFGKEIRNVIVATDYDLEGEVIGATIAKYACGQKLENVKRMKFSALTDDDILHSYENLHPSIDINLANAGFTRHEVDWLYGINLTRALTLAIKHSTGRFKLLSTGRVQGPTLKFIADREREIQTFVPIPRWTIDAKMECKGEEIPLEYSEKFLPTLESAERVVKDTKGSDGQVASISEKDIVLKPPLPFNLGTLQSDVYRYFGYSPSRTLRLAESLYLGALISYPRTSSEKFPDTIKHREILIQLGKNELYRNRITKILEKGALIPTVGNKQDPAHPPIHPTGTIPPSTLRTDEKNIYNLIVCRYLAIFGNPALRKTLRLDITINDHTFYLRGMKILQKGWLELYSPFGKTDEIELPDLTVGDKVKLTSIAALQSYTQPLARFNPNSLLKKMEEEELGTKATRAYIIDILYSRGYIEEESINATDLGFAVIDTLEKNSSDVLSIELTRNLEREMDKITTGEQTREVVLMDSIKQLKIILEGFHKKEHVIGITLEEQVQNLRQRQRVLGKCPVCKQGELILTRSTKTGKRFVGCTGYYRKVCTWSAPIIQTGYASPAKKVCRHCAFPLINIRAKGKRQLIICSNWLNCPGTPKEVLANQPRKKASEEELELESEEE